MNYPAELMCLAWLVRAGIYTSIDRIDVVGAGAKGLSHLHDRIVGQRPALQPRRVLRARPWVALVSRSIVGTGTLVLASV